MLRNLTRESGKQQENQRINLLQHNPRLRTNVRSTLAHFTIATDNYTLQMDWKCTWGTTIAERLGTRQLNSAFSIELCIYTMSYRCRNAIFRSVYSVYVVYIRILSVDLRST